MCVFPPPGEPSDYLNTGTCILALNIKMATSLLLACDLNESKLPPFVLVQEDCGIDGSFLVSSILGQRLKVQNTGTVLVCLHHSVQHYVGAGTRLGFNLNMARDKGTLIVVDVLEDLSNDQSFTSKYLQQSSLTTLMTQIEESVEKLLSTKQSCTVVIDNVAALIDLNGNADAVQRFCNQLVAWATTTATNTTTAADNRISIVLKFNTSNLYPHIVNNLEDFAVSHVHFVRLPSGNFKEVDGKIVYRKRAPNGYDSIEKQLLYKVNDRNVKIFLPGEIGVKA